MEIQSLIHTPTFDAPSAIGKNSFTALLGLTASQAVELLHQPESGDYSGAVVAAEKAPGLVAVIGGGQMWRLDLEDHEGPLCLPLGCSTRCGVIKRVARLSVFANEESLASSSCGDKGGQSSKAKAEQSDSDGTSVCPIPSDERPQQRHSKRKDDKVNRAPVKKSKSAKESTGDGDKLPYVHVSAWQQAPS